MKKYSFKFGMVSGMHCYTLRKYLNTWKMFNNDDCIQGYGY